MRRLIIFSLLSCYACLSCSKDAPANRGPLVPVIPPVVVDTTKPVKTYLALGDSYTIGQSVPDSQRYPVQAVKILNADSVLFAPSEIIAQTGWTTANLLNRLAATPPLKANYDIVTLLIGVNNQYQRLSQTQYKTEFTLLLNKAIAYANNSPKRVIVLSIPDYSVTPFARNADTAFIARQIDSFNVINKEIAMAAEVNYLEITKSTRMALTDPTLIANDGLHPSGKEYGKWADSLAPMIRMALQ